MRAETGSEWAGVQEAAFELAVVLLFLVAILIFGG